MECAQQERGVGRDEGMFVVRECALCNIGEKCRQRERNEEGVCFV